MASRSSGHLADLTARTRAVALESRRAESIETVASSLGRVGILLAADRVELWRLSDRTHVVLQASWHAAGSVTSFRILLPIASQRLSGPISAASPRSRARA